MPVLVGVPLLRWGRVSRLTSDIGDDPQLGAEAKPSSRCSRRSLLRIRAFPLGGQGFRLIGIPVKLHGPDLQLVHHLGLRGDLGESAASLCPRESSSRRP